MSTFVGRVSAGHPDRYVALRLFRRVTRRAARDVGLRAEVPSRQGRRGRANRPTVGGLHESSRRHLGFDVMKLRCLQPMLSTWDMKASIAFWTDVLGFECVNASEGHGWAALRRDGVVVMLALPNQHMGHASALLTGSLYLKTDDVDGLWPFLKGKARTCYPIENFDYGMREFAIFDNNGYVIQLGQELPTVRTA